MGTSLVTVVKCILTSMVREHQRPDRESRKALKKLRVSWRRGLTLDPRLLTGIDTGQCHRDRIRVHFTTVSGISAIASMCNDLEDGWVSSGFEGRSISIVT